MGLSLEEDETVCKHPECPYQTKCIWHPSYDSEVPQGLYIWWRPHSKELVEYCTSYLNA